MNIVQTFKDYTTNTSVVTVELYEHLSENVDVVSGKYNVVLEGFPAGQDELLAAVQAELEAAGVTIMPALAE
jgi:hypothetical protein